MQAVVNQKLLGWCQFKRSSVKFQWERLFETLLSLIILEICYFKSVTAFSVLSLIAWESHDGASQVQQGNLQTSSWLNILDSFSTYLPHSLFHFFIFSFFPPFLHSSDLIYILASAEMNKYNIAEKSMSFEFRYVQVWLPVWPSCGH